MTSIYARAFDQRHNNTLHGQVHVLKSKDREDWAKEAGLSWEINSAPTRFRVPGGALLSYPNRNVLYRSDDLKPLSVVSPRFKTVQPASMLNFFADVSEELGVHLEMAGQAIGGRRIWGMARMPEAEIEIGGKGDKTGMFLLFITACDGGLATIIVPTAVRLYCLNQLPMIMRSAAKGGNRKGAFRVTHSAKFDTQKARAGLALINESWALFETDVRKLSKTKVSEEQAKSFFAKLTGVEDLNKVKESSTVHQLIKTYDTGVGQEGVKGTAWGLVNAVTRLLDHGGRSKVADTRIYNSWMNTGARLKERAFEQALALTS